MCPRPRPVRIEGSQYKTNKPYRMVWFNCSPGNFLSSPAASSQVLSTFRGLTTVFGMGTGGSPQLSPPDCRLRLLSRNKLIRRPKPSKLHRRENKRFSLSLRSFKSSPRHISTGQLNALLQLHTRPINLIFFKVSYQIAL